VSVDEGTGVCRVELVNFDAVASAKGGRMRAGESSEVGTRKNSDAEGDAFRVIEKPLFRHKSRSATLAETPPLPPPEPVRRPAGVAQMLAFAHGLQAAIDRGEYRDKATPRASSASPAPG
jgi:hypothetical protein